MYLSHYQLKKKPFQISSDPRFLWLGENHREALAVLKYGVLDNKGFLLLTGDVGTGKTTLINALVNTLGGGVLVATIPDPGMELLDFLNHIAAGFGIKKKFPSKGEFLFHFQQFLYKAEETGKKVLLIIDEAQRVDNNLLEEIRLLSNIEKQNKKLLNIFFVGQNEFNDLLWEQKNRALRQRITINYNVYALTGDETNNYIKHRLKVAGASEDIFTEEAIAEIVGFSGGFPRMINIICDHSLLTGYVKGERTINAGIIRECAEDLQIPHPSMSLEAPAAVEDKTKKESQPENKPVSEEAVHKFPAADPKKSKALKRIGALCLFAIGLAAFFYIYLYYFSNQHLPFIGRSTSDLIANGRTEALKNKNNQPEHQESLPSVGKLHVPLQKDSDTEQSLTAADKGIISPLSEEPRKNEGEEFVIKITKPAIPITAREDKPVDVITDSEKKLSMEKDQSIKTESHDIPVEEGFLTSTHIINFTHNSNELSKENTKVLEKIAMILMDKKELSVDAVGYTDSSGVYSYNMSLSRFRANIIKSYLVGRGVNPDQIRTMGMSSDNPLAANDTVKGRRANRRVEIKFKSRETASQTNETL